MMHSGDTGAESRRKETLLRTVSSVQSMAGL